MLTIFLDDDLARDLFPCSQMLRLDDFGVAALAEHLISEEETRDLRGLCGCNSVVLKRDPQRRNEPRTKRKCCVDK